jgi:L-asparaginase II
VWIGPAIAYNCSGNHAAILAICRQLKIPHTDYIHAEHPVQQLLVRLIAAFGRSADATPLAIDGCGLPIFGATLAEIAQAYACFGTATEAPLATVRHAMRRRPEYAGGSKGNLDTTIIAGSAGRILGKLGAEGLHADTLVGRGIGVAVKVLDGNSRALPPIVSGLLGRFERSPGDTGTWRETLRVKTVRNAAGSSVGDITCVTGRRPL